MRSLPGGIIALTWTLAYPIDASCTACHKRFRPGLFAPSPTMGMNVVMNWLRPWSSEGSTEIRMNVFVAGGTGTIGVPLVRALVARNHRVFATTRSSANRR